MSLAAPPDHLHSLSGLEGRRSTRIDRTVPLVVLGQTKTGLSFQEKTSTVSFNLHGCRYPSRHEYPIGSSVGLRVLQPDGETISPVIRAFVKSVHPPASPRELFQVGVELESPRISGMFLRRHRIGIACWEAAHRQQAWQQR